MYLLDNFIYTTSGKCDRKRMLNKYITKSGMSLESDESTEAVISFVVPFASIAATAAFWIFGYCWMWYSISSKDYDYLSA
jgi:hypothetical protein